MTGSTPTLADNQSRLSRLLDRDWTMLIGGEPAHARSRAHFEVTSPFTEKRIARVPNGAAEDLEIAVAAAREAAASWASIPATRRAAFVRDLATAIEERALDFAVLDAADCGGPVSIMNADVAVAVESLRYFAGLATEMKGTTVPASANLHYTERPPYGVVGTIIPFNHPIMFAGAKIGAPLVAGNAVILKPSEATPLSALLLGEIAREVLPAGVLSVLVGDGAELPDALVRHPRIKRLSFTGSDAIGRRIQRSAAEVAVKHVSLELGGKNALIGFPDADPVEIAAGAVRGMNFAWSGQSCGSTSRLLVHDSIADETVAAAAKSVADREYFSPLDPRCVQGTIVNRRQYERILAHIEGAVHDGARVVTGGGRPPGVEQGLFIAPTILDEVDPSWAIANEEIFGPVLTVLRWREEEEAIALANSVDLGLTGSVYTNDLRRAHRVARALETGFVWVNGSAAHYQGVPYGGWKNSGLGFEEGIDELLSYTQIKSVNVML